MSVTADIEFPCSSGGRSSRRISEPGIGLKLPKALEGSMLREVGARDHRAADMTHGRPGIKVRRVPDPQLPA